MKGGYLIVAVFTLASCYKEAVNPVPAVAPYEGPYPKISGNDHYDLSGVNDALPTLGRVLFYDRNLSINNDMSCGSCHKQANGFADNVRLSKGTNNNHTQRNTLAIVNNTTSLFWDGRESSLKKMVMMPILNVREMGVTNMVELVRELNALPYYKDLSKKAFNNDHPLSEETISMALSSFVKSIVPGSTRFDDYLHQTGSFFETPPPNTINAQEFLGLNLFVAKYNCNGCHRVEVKPGSSVSSAFGSYASNEPFVNIGLDFVPLDRGRADVTGRPDDAGKFRVPSLRNVELTYPYMHDGRLATLYDVIDHYARGIKATPNLAFPFLNADNTPKTFDISFSEREALIAFLRTLTDKKVVSDPKWSDPFQ
jgi:cytochrome c peroxidase